MNGSTAFLSSGHNCNFCQKVSGVTFNRPPKVEARLKWVRCLPCSKRKGEDTSHYCCHSCARKIGAIVGPDGRRYIAVCARGYTRRLKKLERRS